MFEYGITGSVNLVYEKGNLKKHEGANKMDIALHYLFRAALTGDDKLMKETVKEAFGVLSKGKGKEYK